MLENLFQVCRGRSFEALRRVTPTKTYCSTIILNDVTDNGLCRTTLKWKLHYEYDIYMSDASRHGVSDPFIARPAESQNGDTRKAMRGTMNTTYALSKNRVPSLIIK